ncbi:MAG: alpha/beta fold hydrolase [Caulobacter sp.]|nr:alpha/beta fold hydrolase [Caulobacter sp.]
MSAIETMMPPVQYAQINGIRMAWYEAGPKTGVPVIFSHGFPELAFSWRHQIKALADAGRWVVAPDQRGYGLTERPEEVTSYDLETLCADLVALMDHIGAPKAIFCGHDWGGFVVWYMSIRYPDRVAGVISLNTPFQPRAPFDPIAIMRKRLGERMYIVHFQTPGEADAVLDANPRKVMDFFLRSPIDMPADASAGFATERKEGDPSLFALVDALEAWSPEVDPRPFFLTDEEFEVFAETFERTGFTGGINWYRNFTRNWEQAEKIEHRVRQPALMVMAEKDAVLPPSSADGMEAICDDLEKTLIKGSGHWTQQEKPAETNKALLDWLGRRFPIPPPGA